MMNPGGAAEMTAGRARGAERPRRAGSRPRPGSSPGLIVEAVIVCNPVMHHLLLGIDPVELGQAPFALATSDALDLGAAEIGLAAITPTRAPTSCPASPAMSAPTPPPWRCRRSPNQSDDLMLVVDVGTNAEILLGNREQRPRLLLAHRPRLRGRADLLRPARRARRHRAGRDRPRHQGAAVPRHRVRPLVRRSRPSPRPRAATGITGICGSGIIEAVAEMRIAGLIDASGLIGSAEQTGTAADESPRAAPMPTCFTTRRADGRAAHHRDAGRRPRDPARQVGALRRRAAAHGRDRRRPRRPRGAGGGLRRAYLAEARDGARHDPRLRRSTASPRPATPPAPARASRSCNVAPRREIEALVSHIPRSRPRSSRASRSISSPRTPSPTPRTPSPSSPRS